MTSVQLILQVIDVFDFRPPSEKLVLLVNDESCPYVKKDNGFYVITKELPSDFVLTVQSSRYYPRSCHISNLQNCKQISIQLVPRYPPPRAEAVMMDVDGYSKIVLGYNYFQLSSDAVFGAATLDVENPLRISLEGREFVLRDTKTGSEQPLTVGTATSALLNQYAVSPLKDSYSRISSALLPAFDVTGYGAVPIKPPPQLEAPIWLYSAENIFIKRIIHRTSDEYTLL